MLQWGGCFTTPRTKIRWSNKIHEQLWIWIFVCYDGSIDRTLDLIKEYRTKYIRINKKRKKILLYFLYFEFLRYNSFVASIFNTLSILDTDGLM